MSVYYKYTNVQINQSINQPSISQASYIHFLNAVIAALHMCPQYPTHFLLLFSWPS